MTDSKDHKPDWLGGCDPTFEDPDARECPICGAAILPVQAVDKPDFRPVGYVEKVAGS